LRRLRLASDTEFSAHSKILAVPALRYRFGIINWHQEELQNLNRETRKLQTIHGQHHPKSRDCNMVFQFGEQHNVLQSLGVIYIVYEGHSCPHIARCLFLAHPHWHWVPLKTVWNICCMIIPDLADTCQHFTSTVMSELVIISMDRLVLQHVLKISYYVHYFFLASNHSGNIAGQEWELWKTDAGKQHSEEHCKQYDDALFMWVIFQDQKK
jgi:hypothetical protein